jgi:hypothetical protein
VINVARFSLLIFALNADKKVMALFLLDSKHYGFLYGGTRILVMKDGFI